ncbi:MAG: hypothetical protein AAGJ81_07385 [Verrucomicrobiota bacterium]
MDGLLEILLPLIFFAVYFLSSFLGKKGESEEGAPKKKEDVPDDLRKIREELKRRIAERRQKSGQPQASGAPAQGAREPERGGAVLRESRERRSMTAEREIAPPLQPVEQTLTPQTKAPSYEQNLENQLEEVRRSQERVEAARLEAQKRSKVIQKVATRRNSNRTSSSYRQFLKEALEDPESLQKSFILYEVFGTPVGMRQNGQMKQSWDW